MDRGFVIRSSLEGFLVSEGSDGLVIRGMLRIANPRSGAAAYLHQQLRDAPVESARMQTMPWNPLPKNG
jgi:hypothetical protein